MSAEMEMVQVAIGQVKGYINPTDAERAAAYELLVELSTRTSSAHLASGDDSIREALSDLEQLFDLTRGILRTHGTDASKGSPGNLSLAVVSVRVLNEVIRPVLSRWQPLYSDYEARRLIEAPEMSAVEWEQRWDRGARCRAELRGMRSSIRAYIDTLSRIAGAPEVADAILRVPSSSMVPKQEMTGKVDDSIKPRTKMVRWFDIRELVLMGLANRRGKASVDALNEARDSTPSFGPDLAPTLSIAAERDKEFWFDYVADMGDGFDGTAPVAWLVGRNQLEIPDDQFSEFPTPPTSMPHADLLVFGGDEVYTYAAEGRYESHTELPYTMGVEDPKSGPRKLVAIPGNHDWMGGIEHFVKMFAKKRTFAGHWTTEQEHPWWHVQLPQGWWLWGIDTALDNELVGDQPAYFKQAAEALEPGDRVILCSPVPLWQLRQKFTDEYATLRNTLDPLVRDKHATMPLCLSGDSHYFAHYERLDTDFGEDHITAGGGGAFLQPTHNLAERVPLEGGNAEFKLTSRWPRPADSRALAPGVSNFLKREYWPLMLLLGLLYLAFAGLAAVWQPAALTGCFEDPCEAGWLATLRTSLDVTLRAPWGLAFLALLTVAMIPLIKGNSAESKLTKGIRVYALLTGVAVSATLVTTEVVRRSFLPSGWPGYALATVLGGALTVLVFFFMMTWVNSRIKASDTVAFSPAQSTRFKHFLRFRIDRSGDLTCFAVGIDPVGENWYDAMENDEQVPPHDAAGIPRLHYLWGKTYRKFQPVPLKIAVSMSNLQPSPSRWTMCTVAVCGIELDAATERQSTPTDADPFEEVCKTLIRGGHTLMYGGRPDGGYTERLRSIELALHANNPNAEHHLINYVADFLWDPDWHEAMDRDGRSSMKFIHVSRGGSADDSDEARVISNLSAMRRDMTRDAELRIVIGGNLCPGAPQERLAPGVIEEAFLAVEAGVPVIIAGGFGGAAGLLARAMQGTLNPAELDELARHFRPPDRLPDGTRGPGFRDMVGRFGSMGVLRNGLTDGENEELLRSSDPKTVSKLIVRSVHRIGSHHAQAMS